LNEVRIKENGILIQLEGLAFFAFLILTAEDVVEVTTVLEFLRKMGIWGPWSIFCSEITFNLNEL